LRRILAAYADYYNKVRTHLSLKKDTPGRRPVHARRHLHKANSRRASPSILSDAVIRRDSPFLTAREKDLILGENCAAFYGIGSTRAAF
jgi:hypothetical protein